jgi:hypothetical protein
MAKSKRTHATKTRSTAKVQRKKVAAGKELQRGTTRSNSKQATVIAPLGRPQGATVSAIMKATGWQQHSVRGFLAGVVRRKLGLMLESEKSDGERHYHIVASKVSKPSSEERRPPRGVRPRLVGHSTRNVRSRDRALARFRGCRPPGHVTAMARRSIDAETFAAEIARLRDLNLAELRQRWAKLFQLDSSH